MMTMPRSFTTLVGPLILAILMPLVARSACGDEPASAWLGLAREQAAAVEDPAARSHLYGRIAVGAARLGDEVSYRRDIERAVAALALAPEKPEISPVESAIVESIPSLIALRAKAGDVPGAKALAEEHLKGREPYRPGWMGTIAAAAAAAGDFDGAVATAKSIDSYGRAYALVGVAAALARRNDARAAQIAEMLEDERPTGRSDAYKAIALAHAGAGRYAEAVASLDKVGDEGIRIESRADIAEKQAEAGDIDAACATVASLPRGLKRDLAYYRVVLAQLGRGKIAGAKITAAKVEGAAHRAQLFGAIARDEALAGRRDDARRTAESIPQEDQERLNAFRAIVAAAIQAGDFDGAVRIAEDQAKLEWLADIALAAIDRGREAEARRIVDRLRRIGRDQPEADNRTGLRLAVLEARLGDPKAFDRIAGDLEATLRDRRDPGDRKQVEAMLFGLYVGAGRIGDARRLVREKSVRDIDTMIAWAVTALAASGDLKRAQELTFLLSTPRARESYIGSLASAHRKAGGDTGAVAWVGRLPSPHDRAAAYLGLADPVLSR
jgi:hypothetical protein